MRRLISNSALVTFALVLSATFMQAQMRGSGGGRGFSGGSRGTSSGQHFASGPRSGSGFHSAPSFRGGPSFRGPGVRSGGFVGSRGFAPSNHRVFNSRPFFNRPFRHFGHRPFFVNSCFGAFGCSPFFSTSFFYGSPFFPGYYPFYSDFSYYPPPPPEPVAYYNNNDHDHDVELATAVQRLSDQVEDLRDEQRSSRYAYPQPAAPGTSISAVPPASSTTFIFRDGRRLTARNYAITGQTLWLFDEHAAHKYVLSDLDFAATEQVNGANGVDIRLPANVPR